MGYPIRSTILKKKRAASLIVEPSYLQLKNLPANSKKESGTKYYKNHHIAILNHYKKCKTDPASNQANS